MIFSVLPEMGIGRVPKEAEHLHFVRPIPKKLLEGILKKCKALKSVSMSKSSLKRMPEKSMKKIKERRIRVEEVKRQGRPISMPLEKMQQALEMRKDYQSLREVERVTGISKSTVHYLERYAQRAKIKNGKNVIYLK